MQMSVCLSVTRRYSVAAAKRTLRYFSPSDSHTIVVFPYHTLWQYSDGDPLSGDVEYRGGVEKITIFDKYLALSRKCRYTKKATESCPEHLTNLMLTITTTKIYVQNCSLLCINTNNKITAYDRTTILTIRILSKTI